MLTRPPLVGCGLCVMRVPKGLRMGPMREDQKGIEARMPRLISQHAQQAREGMTRVAIDRPTNRTEEEDHPSNRLATDRHISSRRLGVD